MIFLILGLPDSNATGIMKSFNPLIMVQKNNR
jgi:hypothetical protein